MRGALTVLALVAGLAATESAVAAQPVPITGSAAGGGSLSASLSSAKAKAKPVVLTLSLHTELQCGQPRSPLVVTLPAASSVPTILAPGAVLVGTKPAASIAVVGHRITITAARPGGVLCDVIAPGLITLRFTKGAQLGNPRARGAYTISVRYARDLYKTVIHISA